MVVAKGLGVRARLHRVDRLRERDFPGPLLVLSSWSGGCRQHPQAGQPVAAEVHDRVVGERVHPEQPGARRVRDQRRPCRRVPVPGQRGGRQLEVHLAIRLAAAVVVQDEQPVRGVLDVVLHALPPRATTVSWPAGVAASSRCHSLVSWLAVWT